MERWLLAQSVPSTRDGKVDVAAPPSADRLDAERLSISGHPARGGEKEKKKTRLRSTLKD